MDQPNLPPPQESMLPTSTLAVVSLVGRKVRLDLPGSALVGHLVDVHGGKRQQADQQEIADDDQDRAVHDGVANLGATPGGWGSAGVASASSSSFRRSGRRWKILKMETKMMPNEVEE